MALDDFFTSCHQSFLPDSIWGTVRPSDRWLCLETGSISGIQGPAFSHPSGSTAVLREVHFPQRSCQIGGEIISEVSQKAPETQILSHSTSQRPLFKIKDEYKEPLLWVLFWHLSFLCNRTGTLYVPLKNFSTVLNFDLEIVFWNDFASLDVLTNFFFKL